MNRRNQELFPATVSTAFAGLLLVGCVFGFLAGADILSGAALAIFIFGALVDPPENTFRRIGRVSAVGDEHHGSGPEDRDRSE